MLFFSADVLELAGVGSTKAVTVGASSLAVSETDLVPADDGGLLAAQAGDSSALRSIYEGHATAITRRLLHACGDPELARDLTQDAFVVAFGRLHRFRGQSALSTWLHGIAFNLLRDRRKRARREQSVWERLRGRPAVAAIRPDQVMESKSELARLTTIIAQLDDAKRDAYVLRVVEQLSLEEAAEILGVRVATVSYRARKADAWVRQAFEADDRKPEVQETR